MAMGPRGRGAARQLALALTLLGVVGVTPVWAQRRAFTLPDKEPDFKAFNVPYNGLVTFVRLRYTPSRIGFGGGGGFFGGVNYNWDHDYPRADRHLVTILKELTSIGVRVDGTNILGADDPELFRYPVAYMAEPSYWTFTDREARHLRDYLAKGGFIIFDDFADRQWWEFEAAIQKLLPAARLVQLDATHPIFHSFFAIDTLDFRHPYWGQESVFFGIFEDNDPAKRLLVIVNYNNDIGESWEWSGSGFIPIDLANRAFKLGVNYFVYALTH